MELVWINNSSLINLVEKISIMYRVPTLQTVQELRQICQKILSQRKKMLINLDQNYQKGVLQKLIIREMCLQNEGAQLKIVCVHFQEISSTMDISAHWPREHLKNDVIAFIAESQSQGQGTRSNTWTSSKGNMYLTLLVEVPISLINILPIIATNVTYQCIRRVILQKRELLQCKWINDIFIADKKTSGILIRCSNFENKFYAQIGIGVNIKSSPLPQSTCLQMQEVVINVNAFTQQLIAHLVLRIKNFKESRRQEQIQQYEQRLMYKGELINIWDAKLERIIQTGIFKGISKEANAVILVQGKQIVVTDGRMRSDIKKTMSILA